MLNIKGLARHFIDKFAFLAKCVSERSRLSKLGIMFFSKFNEAYASGSQALCQIALLQLEWVSRYFINKIPCSYNATVDERIKCGIFSKESCFFFFFFFFFYAPLTICMTIVMSLTQFSRYFIRKGSYGYSMKMAKRANGA